MKSAEEDLILLGHGSGGTLTNQLIEDVFQKAYGNPVLDELLDAAVLDVGGGRIAFSTDSFVVDPIFFPGGDIGTLAVSGTVNDLAVSGAEPLYLSTGFIIEEGLPIADLRRIVHSMHDTAQAAGVHVVTGDTKVVGRGSADKVFINTAGIGVIPAGRHLSPQLMEPGDVVLVSGTMGDHGLTILAQREGLSFSTPVESDCAPVNRIAKAVMEVGGEGVKCMRDPTRGGLATTLNELAVQSARGILIQEEEIPFLREVVGACEMLGLDPLYLANEGKRYGFNAWESSRPVLKVYDATNLYFLDSRQASEIYINDFTSSWYIDSIQPEHSYFIELGRILPDGTYIFIARSNMVTTPRIGVSDIVDLEWMVPTEYEKRVYGMHTKANGSPDFIEEMAQKANVTKDEKHISSPMNW